MEVKHLVQTTKLSDVKETTKKLVTLSFDNTVLEAAKILNINNILSAPVMDATGKIGEVVDRLDICLYTLNSLNILDPVHPKTDMDVSKDTLTKLISARGKTKLCTMASTSSFADVLQALVTSHRCYIVDEAGHVSDTITQSDVLKFLVKNINQIPTFAQQTLNTLLVTTSFQLHRTVLTVQTKTLASEAFAKLAQMGVQGIGVVDDNGRLVSQALVSKLKMFENAKEAASCLRRPISHYQSTDPVIVETTDQFGEIVKKLAESGSHRAFLVDVQYRPVAVFTLSDIMAVLCGV